MRRVAMVLNVPEALAQEIVAAIENYDGDYDADAQEQDPLYDLADTIRGSISNTPAGTDVAVTFTA